jgi:hypothetical protein
MDKEDVDQILEDQRGIQIRRQDLFVVESKTPSGPLKPAGE